MLALGNLIKSTLSYIPRGPAATLAGLAFEQTEMSLPLAAAGFTLLDAPFAATPAKTFPAGQIAQARFLAVSLTM